MLRFVVTFLRITTGSCGLFERIAAAAAGIAKVPFILFLVMGHNLFLFSAQNAGYHVVHPGFNVTRSSVPSALPWQSGNGPPGLSQRAAL